MVRAGATVPIFTGVPFTTPPPPVVVVVVASAAMGDSHTRAPSSLEGGRLTGVDTTTPGSIF
jgi:hypothetical protein